MTPEEVLRKYLIFDRKEDLWVGEVLVAMEDYAKIYHNSEVKKQNKMTKVNTIHSFKLNDDGSFTENKVSNANEKANELRTKFGELAIDVVNEVLGAIKHEDNVMYYEIKFWTDVQSALVG